MELKQYVYVKYTDINGLPKGRDYLYLAQEEIKQGDVVTVPLGTKVKTAVVVRDNVPYVEIEQIATKYAIKEILGIKEVE